MAGPIKNTVISYRKVTGTPFDLSKLNERWVVPVSGYAYATVQFAPLGDPTTAAFTIYRSNDGIGEYALEESDTAVKTLGTGADMSNVATTLGYSYLIIKLTTAGASIYADLFVSLSASPLE